MDHQVEAEELVQSAEGNWFPRATLEDRIQLLDQSLYDAEFLVGFGDSSARERIARATSSVFWTARWMATKWKSGSRVYLRPGQKLLIAGCLHRRDVESLKRLAGSFDSGGPDQDLIDMWMSVRDAASALLLEMARLQATIEAPQDHKGASPRAPRSPKRSASTNKLHAPSPEPARAPERWPASVRPRS